MSSNNHKHRYILSFHGKNTFRFIQFQLWFLWIVKQLVLKYKLQFTLIINIKIKFLWIQTTCQLQTKVWLVLVMILIVTSSNFSKTWIVSRDFRIKIDYQDFLNQISNLASQGLWFPNCSEKMSGVAVDPDITAIQTYINARKGFDRGVIRLGWYDRMGFSMLRRNWDCP